GVTWIEALTGRSYGDGRIESTKDERSNVWNRRLRRWQERRPDPHGRAQAARVSGLRLGGRRGDPRRPPRGAPTRGEDRRPRARSGARAPGGTAGGGPHALGDPRQALGPECAPAPRLLEVRRGRPPRHYREPTA